MLEEIERLRVELRRIDPGVVAGRVGGRWGDGVIVVNYWGQAARIPWSTLQPMSDSGGPLSSFDAAMLLHHLRSSDGAAPAGRWISFRELPGGEFYHQAYLGYTGGRLARAFGPRPDEFDAVASSFGDRLEAPAPHTWRFTPLPRVLLAACLWPGDDEVPAQASVLFDENAGRHLPTDGLALLGAGLTGRLLRVAGRD
jgi:hypothetical protein